MAPTYNYTRPYLVVPKLIEQPTWGGHYIAQTKQWLDRPNFDRKIGQSYELFSGSNLSLLHDSADPRFTGELTDRDTVQQQTRPKHSIALNDMIIANPTACLGQTHIAERGKEVGLLVKFTQALGNSFQIHIKTGTTRSQWQHKPEAWYFFEPGLITLGIKPGIDWQAYRHAVTAVAAGMETIGRQIQDGTLPYDQAQPLIRTLLQRHDPWQFVNTLAPEADQLIDLSGGGLHHSWEEDSIRAPQGNVLYELQLDALDNVSTIRCFDKGKVGTDGTVRILQVDDYFELIDRSAHTNNPATHSRQPKAVSQKSEYTVDQLLRSPYYNLDKLTLGSVGAAFTDNPGRMRHLFVKHGAVTVSAGRQDIRVERSHSCFIPAAAPYSVTSRADNTQVLISY